LIVFLSHQSQPPGIRLGLNPLLHFIEYAIFATTLVWGRSTGLRRRIENRQLIWLWLLGTLFALSDEFHQSFVPNRVPSAEDFLLDVAGISAVLATYRLIRQRIH
jgi:VanZ family protein